MPSAPSKKSCYTIARKLGITALPSNTVSFYDLAFFVGDAPSFGHGATSSSLIAVFLTIPFWRDLFLPEFDLTAHASVTSDTQISRILS